MRCILVRFIYLKHCFCCCCAILQNNCKLKNLANHLELVVGGRGEEVSKIGISSVARDFLNGTKFEVCFEKFVIFGDLRYA